MFHNAAQREPVHFKIFSLSGLLLSINQMTRMLSPSDGTCSLQRIVCQECSDILNFQPDS